MTSPSGSATAPATASPPPRRLSPSRRSEQGISGEGEDEDEDYIPPSPPLSPASIEPLTLTPPSIPLSSAITTKLYTSHTLSTLNTRVFEFGSILYLASIFPGDLFYLSVYALFRGVAAVLLAPLVGRVIDTRGRLGVVRWSILGQRIVVAASCVLFWALLRFGHEKKGKGKVWFVPLLVLLACVEKVCAIGNFVAVEKDWVVVIAGEDEGTLRGLNSQMRRIDLVCKLAGPFAIAVLDGISTELAIVANLVMNLGSVVLEYYAIARVYDLVPALQEAKDNQRTMTIDSEEERRLNSENRTTKTLHHMQQSLRSTAAQLALYLSHTAFLPSFACALLYFTVLSFSGQMITYLLSTGLTSLHIAMVRTVSVGFEISATWLAPVVMQRIGPIRSGMWFINWQIVWLVLGTSGFWFFEDAWYAAACLIAGMVLSRVGLWGFDLSVQVIVQEEVEAENRGSFSAIEASWQNVFELCSYATTIFFSRPDEFQWPILMSCAAVLSAAALYAGFVRKRRGHLLHWSRCLDPGEGKRRAGYEVVGSSRRERGMDV